MFIITKQVQRSQVPDRKRRQPAGRTSVLTENLTMSFKVADLTHNIIEFFLNLTFLAFLHKMLQQKIKLNTTGIELKMLSVTGLEVLSRHALIKKSQIQLCFVHNFRFYIWIISRFKRALHYYNGLTA